MADDVAFAKLSIEPASRIGTATRWAFSVLHTCLMTEKVLEIQAESRVARMSGTINNTSPMKRQIFASPFLKIEFLMRHDLSERQGLQEIFTNKGG